MQQQPRYQLTQPRYSRDIPLFVVDLAAERQNQQMKEQQRGQPRNNERLSPIYASAGKVERPSPQRFTQYTSRTDDNRSDIGQSEFVPADRRTSLQQTAKAKRKKSSRCCRSRRRYQLNPSYSSSNTYVCCCCCYSSGDSQRCESTPNQVDDTGSCCDCDNCCQCDSGCPCDCDCGSCDCSGIDCGDCDIC